MNDENLTKEQLIAELAKLRQRNMEVEQALKDKDCISKASELLPPSGWFSTGRDELFVSNRPEQEPSINDSKKYRFSDLVDIPLLRKFLQSLYEATQLPHAIMDTDNNILSGIGWQDICVQFHRACPQTECWCKQSDSYIAAHLHDGPYVGYRCLNGLMDYATPIIVDGEHLATVFIGQFLHQPPDEEFFCRQAQTYGFDEVAYMQAVHRVPIIPEAQVEAIMDFYIQLAQFLATLGLERKRQNELAEQALRKQQERLSLVWETSNDGFWDWNIKTGVIYLNPSWAQLFTCLPEKSELHIGTWKKIVHPDDIIAAMRTIGEHLKGRTAKYEVEYRVLTKFNEWKWIMVRGQVVTRNQDGRPLRMAGTCIDITDRKKAEAALLQSEQKFSKVFHGNPDLISISTLKEERYVEVNDAFVEITGYELFEVIGRTTKDLNIWVVPAERDIIIKKIQECGRVRNVEAKYRMKTGEIRTFDISAEIIEIDGEAHLLLTTRDITKRKNMEAALRLSEECLFKAFNTSPIIMAITSMEEGRFIKANKAFGRIVGYEHEEVIGRTSLEIGFWLNPAERYLVKQSLMSNQSIQDMEIGFCKKTGEQRRGLYSAERLEIDGELCMLSVLTDITELRRLEIEITRLDRLNLVGEIAASIGHEIRNPLTTVRGYLQILRENQDYLKELEYFDLMIEELDRANSIITDFLSLAKNKMVEMMPINLNAIINKSLPLIQARAMSNDQYIKLELAEVPDLLLDNKEIRQLILNLVNNGLESMSDPGEVTIRTFMEEEKVVLAVQDQGHGIDYRIIDKLGTPFLTTKEQGTGLGLAVCYRIATQHKASIDVETGSTGTTFYVRFPKEGLYS